MNYYRMPDLDGGEAAVELAAVIEERLYQSFSQRVPGLTRSRWEVAKVLWADGGEGLRACRLAVELDLLEGETSGA